MNITVRNIPEKIVRKIRALSQMGKRSLNNEILLLLERGVQEEVNHLAKTKKNLQRNTIEHLEKTS